MVLLLISPELLTANRGANFITLITGVLRQISSDSNKNQICNIVLPILVKYKGIQMPKKFTKEIDKIIEGLNKKFIEHDIDFENIFEGSQFP